MRAHTKLSRLSGRGSIEAVTKVPYGKAHQRVQGGRRDRIKLAFPYTISHAPSLSGAMNDFMHSNDPDELKRWLSIYQGKSRKQAQENFDLTAENAYLKEQVARLQTELKHAQDVDACATCPGCASRSQMATRCVCVLEVRLGMNQLMS